MDSLEEACVQALIQQPRTHKGRLLQEHYVAALLEKIAQNAGSLESLYNDSTGREADLQAITGKADAPLDCFYKQLEVAKERHRRLGTSIDDMVETEALKTEARLTDAALNAKFSGEESLGRYLDLLEPYEMYVNLKDVKRVEYLRYLDQIHCFLSIPPGVKATPQYAAYLKAVRKYLENFLNRSRPLFDYEAVLSTDLEAFETDWKNASVLGWEDMAKNESEELYCEPCLKQFYNAAVYHAHIPGKKHQRAASAKTNGSSSDSSKNRWAHDVARDEAAVASLMKLLEKEREETKGHVEAKQSRSSAERALDLEHEEEHEEAFTKKNSDSKKDKDDESSDESDPKIYNPLNLPLDWDGKPIPYWLWKLHGLGTRYPCEICGGQVYMGRKAFDQHFYEWRHSHGLRSLSIPNTRHFFQVTSIEDAQVLWDKLKRDARQASFRPEVMEEMEDREGNVYSRKTYEDLKRQGLL